MEPSDRLDTVLMQAVVQYIRGIRLEGGAFPSVDLVRAHLERTFEVSLALRTLTLELWVESAQAAMERREAARRVENEAQIGARDAAAGERAELAQEKASRSPPWWTSSRSPFVRELGAMFERLDPDPEIVSSLWVGIQYAQLHGTDCIANNEEIDAFVDRWRADGGYPPEAAFVEAERSAEEAQRQEKRRRWEAQPSPPPLSPASRTTPSVPRSALTPSWDAPTSRASVLRAMPSLATSLSGGDAEAARQSRGPGAQRPQRGTAAAGAPATRREDARKERMHRRKDARRWAKVADDEEEAAAAGASSPRGLSLHETISAMCDTVDSLAGASGVVQEKLRAEEATAAAEEELAAPPPPPPRRVHQVATPRRDAPGESRAAAERGPAFGLGPPPKYGALILADSTRTPLPLRPATTTLPTTLPTATRGVHVSRNGSVYIAQPAPAPAPQQRALALPSTAPPAAPISAAVDAANRSVLASAHDWAKLRAMFQRADRDHDGVISVRDMMLALRHDAELASLLHLPSHIHQEGGTRAAFERVFAVFDEDHSREITFEEFLAHIMDWSDEKATSVAAAEVPRGAQPEGGARCAGPADAVSLYDGDAAGARRRDAPATEPAAPHHFEAPPTPHSPPLALAPTRCYSDDAPAPPPGPPTARSTERLDATAVDVDTDADAANGAANGAAMSDTRGDLARINDVLDNLFAVEPGAAAATTTRGRAARGAGTSSSTAARRTAPSTSPAARTARAADDARGKRAFAARRREEAVTVNGVWQRLDEFAAQAEERQRAEERARDGAQRKARVEANERDRIAELRQRDAEAEAEAQAIVEQWLTPLDVAAGAPSTSPRSRREARAVRTPGEEARVAREDEAAREAAAQRAREAADDARRARDIEAHVDAGVQRAIDRAIADALGDAPIETSPSLTPAFAIPDFIAAKATARATDRTPPPPPTRSARWGAPPPDLFVPTRSPPPYAPPPPPAAAARVHVNRAGSIFVGRPEARGLHY